MIALLAITALAAPITPVESQAVDAREELAVTDGVKPRLESDKSGLTVLALAQGRLTMTDVITENPFLNGQLLGTLGGSNDTIVDNDVRGTYVEQRVNAFFTWAPPLLDERVELGAAFEVDFAWGDTSYATGGNTGGGIGADQVNLQTRRLFVGVRPELPGPNKLHIVAGQQFLSDSVNDPSEVGRDGLFRSGGRLMFWGTEAAGIQAFGKHSDWLKYRAGVFTLYEVGLTEDDDIWLSLADVQLHPTYGLDIGVHGWWLFDRAGGSGGLLGTGPTSALAELQGGARLDLRDPGETVAPETQVNLGYVGLDVGYNAGLTHGPLGVHGLVVYNGGGIYTPDKSIPISGWTMSLEGRWRYWRGDGTEIRAQFLHTSADDADESRYTGVITGNSYGIASAFNLSPGGHLMFPDAWAVNRQVAIVYDISGMGQGLIAADASAALDLIPGRFNVRGGVIHARNAMGGVFGTEVHGHVSAEPFLFFNVGLHGGWTAVGDAALVDENPWAFFLSFDWLAL